MSATFLIIFLLVLASIVFWRVTLALAVALLLAIVLTGIVDLGNVLNGGSGHTDIVAPAAPDNRAQQPGADGVEPPR